MIRCIVFIILCATVGKGVAQIHKNVDDLKTRLGMASHDTTRFKIYIDLSFAYTSIDMDSAFFYQRKAVDLRDAIPPIAFQSTIHNLTGVLFYRERNYDSSIYHYRKGLEINQKIGRTYGIALNYTQIGLLHYQLRDFDSAKHYYFLAKDLFISMGDSINLARNHNNLALNFKKEGKYGEAIDHYYQALSIYEKDPSHTGEVLTQLNIAGIYIRMKQYEKSIDLLKQIIPTSVKARDKRNLSNVYTSLGMAYYELGMPDSAITNYKRSLKIKQELNDPIQTSVTHGKLAAVYMDIGKPEIALKAYLNVEELSQRYPRSFAKTIVMKNFIALAEAYFVLDDSRNSLKYVLKAESTLKQMDKEEELMEAYLLLSELYEKQLLFERALALYKYHHQWSDSILTKESRLKLLKVTKAYEVQKQDQLIANLKMDQERARTKKILLVVTIIFLIIVVAILLLWMRNIQMKNKKIRQKEHQIAEQKIIRIEKDLASSSHQLAERNELIDLLNNQIDGLNNEIAQLSPQYVEDIIELTKLTILTDDEWGTFKNKFHSLYPLFIPNLHRQYPKVTNTEEKLFALLKLHMSKKEMADMLGISSESVKTAMYRLRKKLQLSQGDDLNELVETI